VFDFIEKLDKLLKWRNAKASTVYLIILLVVFVVVAFLPIRYFVLLASKFMHTLVTINIVLKKFNKGRTYYKRRFIGSREACKIELRNFFLNQQIFKLKELVGSAEHKWLNDPWPQ
jgi:hypothetical protein